MSAAAYPPYPPASPEVVRPPSGAAIPALIALGANVLWLTFLAVAGFWGIFLVEDGTARSRDAGDALALGTLAELLLTVVAGVPVIVWLWRARANADVVDDLAQSWSRPWVIFGWVVPIVSFWVPRVIVAAVWRVSSPHGTPVWPVNLWWTAYLVYLVCGRLASADPADGSKAAIFPFTMVIGAVAALLAMMVVWKITRFQEAQAARLREAMAAGDMGAA